MHLIATVVLLAPIIIVATAVQGFVSLRTSARYASLARQERRRTELAMARDEAFATLIQGEKFCIKAFI